MTADQQKRQLLSWLNLTEQTTGKILKNGSIDDQSFESMKFSEAFRELKIKLLTSHLRYLFTAGKFKQFKTKLKSFKTTAWICDVCKNDIYKLNTIMCDICLCWKHKCCVKLDDTFESTENWFCEKCCNDS